ncbi:hypothetical protein E5288_WYG009393 [Bos mutus]|uniref:Uncharacterized protein n=1 Tax=Bos mutus TaxID=72004 RepID=A0A6B0RCV2_9CETA|nr:hypothetical protein [Bos mutus]
MKALNRHKPNVTCNLQAAHNWGWRKLKSKNPLFPTPTRGGALELSPRWGLNFGAQERKKPADGPEAVVATSGGACTPGAGATGPEIVLGISGAPCPEVPALVLTGTLPFFLPRDGSTK